MPLLAATNLCFTIGQTVILDGATISIEAGERIGLVGKNGAGKSTLMRLITGDLTPDTGSTGLQRGVRVGYLKQDPVLDHSLTLREEAATAFTELTRLHEELDEVYHDMERVSASNDPDMAIQIDRLLKKQVELDERMHAAGGYAVDHKIEAVLHGLGFTDAHFGIKVAGLSGGQKGRLALAKLLLESPDLLLLDEPTNHLDIAGREWLEDFLVNEFRGAVLIVSHDRYMLDRVVTRIEEVEQGRLIDYPGNYTAFREIRYMRRLTQYRAFEKQQDKFRKEEEYIRRFKAGQRAKQAQGRLSKLDREKRDSTLERPMEMPTMTFALPKPPRSGDVIVVARNMSKQYHAAPKASKLSPETGEPDDTAIEPGATKVLFKDLDVTLSRGERWGIIGPNGAGKTTLVRALLGQIPLDSGTVKLGSTVVPGYYSQTGEEADESLAVYEYLQLIIKRENPANTFSEQQARDLAGAFLFSGRDQDKRIGNLSGGERSRARLAGLLASAKNLLILDEPTNHLDISSAERLEAVLKAPSEDDEDDRVGGFEGTMILISHDRALIDATCDHLLVLDGHGGAEVFLGNYTEWHKKQIARAAAEKQAEAESQRRRDSEQAKRNAAAAAAASASKKPSKPAPKQAEKGAFSWMSQEKLEKEIAGLEARLKQIDGLLSDEEVYRDAARCRDLLSERDAAQGKLTPMEQEWIKRAEG
ncbi:MAG: ABC-F family ATP-binding cassette domain-containing protein [Pyrinomonadaceae bacterium]|nr:ABC-F family ATP-binding cassette domain-containing protein [Phycisphaerales bacterium]